MSKREGGMVRSSTPIDQQLQQNRQDRQSRPESVGALCGEEKVALHPVNNRWLP